MSVGFIVFSSYTSYLGSANIAKREPFTAVEIAVEDHLKDAIGQFAEPAANITIDEKDFTVFYFGFDTKSMEPGTLITPKEVVRKGFIRQPLDFFQEYFSERTGISQRIEPFEPFFNNAYVKMGQAIHEARSNADYLSKNYNRTQRHNRRQMVPYLRHIIAIEDVMQLQKVSAAVKAFFSYRPHETHYPIQGLILAIRVIQAYTEPGQVLHLKISQLLRHYPRRFFQSASNAGVFPSDQIIGLSGWDVRYQQHQMTHVFHHYIRQVLQKRGYDRPIFSGMQVLGTGCNLSALAIAHFRDELSFAGEYSDDGLVDLLINQVIKPFHGYHYLSDMLCCLPARLGLMMLEKLCCKTAIDQRVGMRLLENIRYGRIACPPVPLLELIYENMRAFPEGKIINLSHREFALAAFFSQIPDGAIDTLQKAHSHKDDEMGEKTFMLLETMSHTEHVRSDVYLKSDQQEKGKGKGKGGGKKGAFFEGHSGNSWFMS